MNLHAAHLRCTNQPEGTVVLDTARGVLSTLNSTGGFIWQGLQDGKSQEEIVRLLVAETDGSEEIIAQDVAAFAAELEANALLPERRREELR